MVNFTSYLSEIDRQRESEPPFREWMEAYNKLTDEQKEAIRDEVFKTIERLDEEIYREAWEETHGKAKRIDGL